MEYTRQYERSSGMLGGAGIHTNIRVEMKQKDVDSYTKLRLALSVLFALLCLH